MSGLSGVKPSDPPGLFSAAGSALPRLVEAVL